MVYLWEAGFPSRGGGEGLTWQSYISGVVWTGRGQGAIDWSSIAPAWVDGSCSLGLFLRCRLLYKGHALFMAERPPLAGDPRTSVLGPAVRDHTLAGCSETPMQRRPDVYRRRAGVAPASYRYPPMYAVVPFKLMTPSQPSGVPEISEIFFSNSSTHFYISLCTTLTFEWNAKD